MQASREELVEAEEVGEKIAEAILDYFADEENRQIIERLRKAGIRTEADAKVLQSESLAGKSFVISGKFTAHSRDELKEMIESHGGKNLSAVSANVDFLVAGDKVGPAKLQKATKLGIRLISEEELISMIAQADSSDNRITISPTPHPVSGKAEEKTPINETAEQGSLF